MLRASARLVAKDPSARGLFVAGAVLTLLASTAIFWPAARWAQAEGSSWPFFLVIAASAWPLTVLAVFSNVALLHVVDRHADGRPATARDGLRVARSRFGQIVAWSLLATGVGLLLDLVAERVPFGGRLVSFAAGAAWGLVTLFAIPILAVEGCGPRECFRRSATTFRRRWGDGVAGAVAIFACLLVVTFPAAMVLCAGIAGGADDTASVVAIGVGWIVMTLVGVVSQSMRQLFALALWREDTALPGFTVADLEGGLRLREPGRLRYRRSAPFSKNPDDY